MVALNAEPYTKPRYRFIDEGGQHLHTLDGKPLLGTSTVVDVLGKPLAYYASGRAVMEFGVPDPKVLTKLKNGKATKAEKSVLFEALGNFIVGLKMMSSVEDYAKLCTRAYFAHKTHLDK